MPADEQTSTAPLCHPFPAARVCGPSATRHLTDAMMGGGVGEGRRDAPKSHAEGGFCHLLWVSPRSWPCRPAWGPAAEAPCRTRVWGQMSPPLALSPGSGWGSVFASGWQAPACSQIPASGPHPTLRPALAPAGLSPAAPGPTAGVQLQGWKARGRRSREELRDPGGAIPGSALPSATGGLSRPGRV